MSTVVIATGLYAPEIGGPATHTRLLEEGLPAQGIRTIVVPFRSVRPFPPGVRHLLYAYTIWRQARNADLVFSQDPFSVGFPALIAARLAGKKYIVRVPGDYAWEQARERWGVADSVENFQKGHYGFTTELTRTIEHFVVRHADHVVVPSAFLAGIVRLWRPRALSVIPNGVELSPQEVEPRAVPPAPFILTASRLVRGKGFACLIDLLRDLHDWRLVIVGEGPLHAELLQKAETSGVRDRVRFAGAVSPEEMRGWYRRSTVFVLNSGFESFSFQVIEALASGTPTIATRVGAIPEVLRDGVDGVLVAPDDIRALTEVIESVRRDAGIWERRRKEGRIRAQEFGAERMNERFSALFTDAMLGRHP